MHLLDRDDALARNCYYTATAGTPPRHAPLAGDVRADVAVVGGGLAGLSAALDLARRGRRVVLLDARTMGSGASGRNGGQAIHGLACDMEVIESQLGPADARRVWAMTLEALDLLRARMAEHRIDADWRDGWLGVATSVGKAKTLQAWADRMAEMYGLEVERIPRQALARWIDSPRYHFGVHDPNSGHLHPLRYAHGLARAAVESGVALHEHSAVERLEPRADGVRLHVVAGSGAGHARAATKALGTVQADQVLIAGNVTLGALAPALADRIMPVGTFIACSERLDPALFASLVPSGAAVCDNDFVLDYFRPTPDHRMLYGGRVSYSTTAPRDLAASMRVRMLKTFPQLRDARIEYAWGGFVDITMNRAPDFGRLDDRTYYLQGFSGHGLALTGLAGRLVADAMCGDAERFDVFTRLKHRRFPGGRWLRTPSLVLGMAWYRLRDMLG